MPHLPRRDFLRAALAAGVLAVLPSGVLQAASPEKRGRVLVILHLSGGNDGLNTLVPYKDPAYRRLRPTLALPAREVLPVDRGLAMHPAMGGLHDLYGKGRLALVPGAGYPQPSFSHFRSAEIWHSASTRPSSEGWIGRYLDLSGTCEAFTALALDPAPPQALVGRTGPATTFTDPERFRIPAAVQPAAARYRQAAGRPGLLGEVGRRGARILEGADRLARLRPAARPPGAGLARDLRMALALLEADLGLRVLHLSMGGFDTHVGQAGAHARLLGDLSAALAGFQEELGRRGLADRVITLVFSEFGRRPAENSGGGTDHGTSGPMLLMGSQVRGGVLSEPPPLGDLVDDNLRHTLDFRSVYAGLLRDWLGADPAPVVGTLPPLACVRT